MIKTDSEIHSSIVCLNTLNVNYLIIEETSLVLFYSIVIFLEIQELIVLRTDFLLCRGKQKISLSP